MRVGEEPNSFSKVFKNFQNLIINVFILYFIIIISFLLLPFLGLYTYTVSKIHDKYAISVPSTSRIFKIVKTFSSCRNCLGFFWIINCDALFSTSFVLLFACVIDLGIYASCYNFMSYIKFSWCSEAHICKHYRFMCSLQLFVVHLLLKCLLRVTCQFIFQESTNSKNVYFCVSDIKNFFPFCRSDEDAI
jgi:hypothetical protein